MSGRVGGPALQVVGRVLTRRFMDSRHDFLVAHWDYEPTKASASRCSLYASVNCGRRSANPKGIPARARVARNELPWENVPTRINPNGLQPEFVPSDGGASTPSGEWRLHKTKNFLAQSFTAWRVGHGFKQNLAAETLHFLERGLELAPLSNSRPQPFILFLGQSHADRFSFDLAGPLVAGTTGAWTAILHIALADPAKAG